MASKTEISTKNMEVTDRINDYVTKKIAKFDRLLNSIHETHVDLAYNKSARNAADRHIAQITIRGKGFILRSEERADDIFAAIDAVQEKMQRQIERFKGKRYHSRTSGASVPEIPVDEEIVEVEESRPVIARRKEFNLVPMDEMEALDQMVLLGHENFFIFYNANSSKINVLYRRRDGTYGLIDPQVG
ncbi:MAG: ribosome-associated translation inhibitor RaiA [Anaerolineae bacterium]|nr:ribosome-associated translation inhibitor RaiA [Anaerolineae bacterium]